MCFPEWEKVGEGKWECSDCELGPCRAPPEALKFLEGPKIEELNLAGKTKLLVYIRMGCDEVSTISAKVVKAKRDRICDNCRQMISKGEKYMRLYGSFDGDPPYTLSQHVKCLVKCRPDKKMLEALQKAGVGFVCTFDKQGYIEEITEVGDEGGKSRP